MPNVKIRMVSRTKTELSTIVANKGALLCLLKNMVPSYFLNIALNISIHSFLKQVKLSGEVLFAVNYSTMLYTSLEDS